MTDVTTISTRPLSVWQGACRRSEGLRDSGSSTDFGFLSILEYLFHLGTG